MIGLLLDRAEQIRADLQGLLFSISHVQGASLEVDRYWLASFLHNRTERPSLLDPVSHAWWSRYRCPKWDLEYRPDDWASYCKSVGLSFLNSEPPSPLVIRVFLESQYTSLGSFDNTTPTLAVGDAGILPRAFQDHAIVYEVAPPATALSVRKSLIFSAGERDLCLPAISVGRRNPNTAGSLSGVISTGDPEHAVAVSCAHVFGIEGTTVYSPGPFEGRSHERVGVVKKHWIAELKKEQVPCDHENFRDAGRLDMAVAEVRADWGSRIGQNLRIADDVRLKNQMEQDAVVYFRGKVSGMVYARISGVSIWKEISTADFGTGFGGRRCFGGLLELMSLDGDGRCVARPGDSGAWVFDNDGSLQRWNGMIIAAHGRRAVATIAEYMMETLRSEYANASLL